MYDHFVGEVCAAAGTQVVLRVNGIGYDLAVPVSTSAGLKVGDTAMLHTILHVNDGKPTLLGFRSAQERELARRLMTVSSVGPKVALAVLSTFGPGEIANAILGRTPATLQKVKGVGAKTAERMCLELHDQIAKMDLGPAVGVAAAAPIDALPAEAADAIAALITLGYTEKDARTRIERLQSKHQDSSTEELIKLVLRG